MKACHEIVSMAPADVHDSTCILWNVICHLLQAVIMLSGRLCLVDVVCGQLTMICESWSKLCLCIKKENELWPNVNKTTSIIILCLEAYRDQEPSPDRTSSSESGSESSHSGSQSASSSGSSSSEEDSRAGSAHGNAAPPAEVPQSTNRTSALCLRNISLRSGGRY